MSSEQHVDRLTCQAETRDECDDDSHWVEAPKVRNNECGACWDLSRQHTYTGRCKYRCKTCVHCGASIVNLGVFWYNQEWSSARDSYCAGVGDWHHQRHEPAKEEVDLVAGAHEKNKETAVETKQSYDNLKIPANNLLDGREYEQYLRFAYPNELREGDIITDGVGTYQVLSVGNWDWQTNEYIRHIRIVHTLAGPIMGGLLRGHLELVHVLARRRSSSPESGERGGA